MKKLSILIMAFITLVGFNACSSDDDVVFIANPDAEGIQFTNAFASNYDLTDMAAGDVVERFVWNEIDVEVPTNINYVLQGSLTEDFESFEELASTPTNNVDVTAGQLIKLAGDAELDETGSIDMYFRVVASPGTAGEMAHNSEVVSFSAIIPTEVEYVNLYLVGDVTATGWDNKANGNNHPLFRDPTNLNVYYYTGRFNGSPDAEGFKLVEVLGQWQPQWGVKDGSLTNSTILGEDPSAFPVDSDGYFSFTINTEELTYSFEPYDASGATTYDMIGLVGAGTTVGWPNDDNPTPDIMLTKSEFNPHLWTAKDVVLSEAGIKFRANQDWAVNWGGGENFPSGKATSDDIIVSNAGTYDVWFNDLTGRYIFIEQTPTE